MNDRISHEIAKALLGDKLPKLLCDKTESGEGQWVIHEFENGALLSVERVLNKSKATLKYSLASNSYPRGDDIKKLRQKAKQRIIAQKWKKLGGKIGILCESCAWLSLGYSKCRKCGSAQGSIA